jgi:hypothetical protein
MHTRPARPQWASSIRALLACTVLACGMPQAAEAPVGPEPIAFIGHSAMFDATGREAATTLAFLRSALAWYRRMLLAATPEGERAQFLALERELSSDGPALDAQALLVRDLRLLEWLLARAAIARPDRLEGKLKLVRRELRWRLEENTPAARRVAYQLPAALAGRLDEHAVLNGRPSQRVAPAFDTVSGDDYRALCQSRGVPVPPDFGPGSPWVSKGTYTGTDAMPTPPGGAPKLPQLFILSQWSAEVLAYESAAPQGLCVALPRYDTGDTVRLDGIICLGQSDPLDPGGRPKACFWDNQDASGNPFEFRRGTAQAISQWAGGAALVGGTGGECTTCHAGENPYIIQGTPLGSLGPLATAPKWHDPIVGSAWIQNPGPMNSPPSCSGCHGTAGAPAFAGRLPHISSDLVEFPGAAGYCDAVLKAAVGVRPLPPAGSSILNVPPTMPAGSPGSLACTPNLPATDPRYRACGAGLTASCSPGLASTDANYLACTPELNALLAWCGTAPAGDASSRGDPHVTTFNGTRYDFQGAGEFVYLRNGSDVEVQVRQSPVSSAAPVGPDAHTGLTTCPSINTALAARIGKNRVSYMPPRYEQQQPPELRIDGKLVSLPSGSIKVGGGKVTRSAVGGGIEIDFPDKSRLIAVPDFWGAPHNRWYFNIDVLGARAREGVAGAILSGQWLPLKPDGLPMGPKPASLAQRWFELNTTFANAWRVTPASSLFDYAPGTSTATYTFPNWPPQTPPCTAPGSNVPPVYPMTIDKAKSHCTKVTDTTLNAQCVFDVAATSNVGFVNTYLLTQQLRPKGKPAMTAGAQR